MHTNQCPRRSEVSVPGKVVVAGVCELSSVGDEDRATVLSKRIMHF